MRPVCCQVALVAMGLVACAGAHPAPAPEPAAVSVPLRPSAEPAEAEPTGAKAPPGTRELVLELEAAERGAEPERRWHETRRILAAIRALADPRGADALAQYVADARGWPGDPERVHRRTLAAFALAELADLRALPVLAARLALDPLEVYRGEDPNQAELRRSDQERVIAARLIADLAALHPDARPLIRKEAQTPVEKWLESGPSPHANGMRALARMQAEDDSTRKKLLAWADPPGALPKPGALPPFEEKWAVAQSALRYAGALRDDRAWPILQKQLARRPKTLDATMDGLMAGGSALLGMTVRALAFGAASGFAEWGDARAVPHLLAHTEDSKQNESSRQEACRALGLTLDAAHEPEVTLRLGKWKGGKDKVSVERVSCLLEVLRRHPIAAASPLLLELSDDGSQHRMAAARALGYAGFDAAVEKELGRRLASATTRPAAALALLLGGSADAAQRVGAAFPGEGDSAELTAFQDDYFRGVDLPSDSDLRAGRLYRFVQNARALAQTERGGKPVDFAVRLLQKQLAQADFDSGPGSLPRVLLRKRLFDAARSGPVEQRAAAVDGLELLGERGVLLALGAGTDAVARRAASAAAAPEPAPAPR